MPNMQPMTSCQRSYGFERADIYKIHNLWKWSGETINQ